MKASLLETIQKNKNKYCSGFNDTLLIEYFPLTSPHYNSLYRQHKGLYYLVPDILNISFKLNLNFSKSRRNFGLFSIFKHDPDEHSCSF